MSVALKTLDQVPGAPSAEGRQLAFEVGSVTVREIVRTRVRLAVDRYNNSKPPPGRVSLVTPTQVERELNRPRGARRSLDAERQIEVALEAVREGRVIILFNGVQVSDLAAPRVVTPVRSKIPQARSLTLEAGT